ncbi:hypothetical protein RhiirC2_756153 [Rhizophagus irregularis]|uniref:Uncharacterized protein n=1 Tax=Rhizophagus irregularis TaxID=588596 RepID=A0A2N1MSZ9_9GLOM|nr:hypothetical protein RhiirC2_756153 [Rhizophagus irregularis]
MSCDGPRKRKWKLQARATFGFIFPHTYRNKSWTVILNILSNETQFRNRPQKLQIHPTLMASEVFLSDSGIFSGIRVINNSQSDRVDLPSRK